MPSEGMKSSTICISFCLLHPGSRLDRESKDDFKEPYLFCHASLLSSGHSREKLVWKYSQTVDSFTFTVMWINCIAAAYWLYRNKSLLLQLTQWQPADQSLVSDGDGCACLVLLGLCYFVTFPSAFEPKATCEASLLPTVIWAGWSEEGWDCLSQVSLLPAREHQCYGFRVRLFFGIEDLFLWKAPFTRK